MGFAGPVKSVSTTRQTFMQQPTKPASPAIFYPLTCEQCEFDRQGNEVRSQHGGAVERKTLDGLGRVQEEVWEKKNGEVTSQSMYANGPAGKVEEEDYRNGKLFRTATFRYDGQGNLVESSTHMPDGSGNCSKKTPAH